MPVFHAHVAKDAPIDSIVVGDHVITKAGTEIVCSVPAMSSIKAYLCDAAAYRRDDDLWEMVPYAERVLAHKRARGVLRPRGGAAVASEPFVHDRWIRLSEVVTIRKVTQSNPRIEEME